MELNNIDHFADLTPEMQDALLEYIMLNFHPSPSINYSHSAYGLKQHFCSSYRKAMGKFNITSQCFAEAMEHVGFESKRTSDLKEPNWNFNIRKLHRPLRP